MQNKSFSARTFYIEERQYLLPMKREIQCNSHRWTTVLREGGRGTGEGEKRKGDSLHSPDTHFPLLYPMHPFLPRYKLSIWGDACPPFKTLNRMHLLEEVVEERDNVELTLAVCENNSPVTSPFIKWRILITSAKWLLNDNNTHHILPLVTAALNSPKHRTS